jgi:hypothetical protein
MRRRTLLPLSATYMRPRAKSIAAPATLLKVAAVPSDAPAGGVPHVPVADPTTWVTA